MFSNTASFSQIILVVSHLTRLLKAKTRPAVFPLGLATELYLYFWFTVHLNSQELAGFSHCLTGANLSAERVFRNQHALQRCFFFFPQQK